MKVSIEDLKVRLSKLPVPAAVSAQMMEDELPYYNDDGTKHPTRKVRMMLTWNEDGTEWLLTWPTVPSNPTGK